MLQICQNHQLGQLVLLLSFALSEAVFLAHIYCLAQFCRQPFFSSAYL